jgi:hypothetical protein
MPRRIELELTSDRGDGTWTWRAAGAREPRGVLEGSLLPAGSKVGDVHRAEVDIDLDGVSVLAIVPPQQKHRNEPQRIEVIGRPVRDEQLVTSTLTSRDKRDGGPRRDRGERGERDGDRRPPRDGREKRAAKEPRESRPPRERAERRPPRPKVEEPPKPKAKRLRPARTHRTALLAELPPEHRPIAEQVLQGDIPAVRTAIDNENQARATKGESPINGSELLAIAERLRPRLRSAEWRDRAEAALADVEELDLRDLRSVVVAADTAARDDDARALAAQLREAVTRRVDEAHAAWLAEVAAALDDGRTVRALRLSSRPPKAGTIFPTELNARLAEAASAALTADAVPARWAIVLDAVAHSPVRLSVKPQSLPTEPAAELLDAVRKLASRVPEIAGLFGIEPTAGRAARGPRKAPPKAAPRPPKPPNVPPATSAVPTAAAAAPTAPPSAPVEEPQQVERPVEDDVAREVPSASVPAGDGEPTPDVEGAAPVVVGVADEDDVVGLEVEGGEEGPELLGAVPEGIREEDDLGPPSEAPELGGT